MPLQPTRNRAQNPRIAQSRRRDASTPHKKDQRSFERFSALVTIRASFILQGKATPVAPGVWFGLRLIDVGRGGAQIGTDWPLSRGDILLLELPAGDDRVIKRYVRVVRVRAGETTPWCAGTCFIERPRGV